MGIYPFPPGKPNKAQQITEKKTHGLKKKKKKKKTPKPQYRAIHSIRSLKSEISASEIIKAKASLKTKQQSK